MDVVLENLKEQTLQSLGEYCKAHPEYNRQEGGGVNYSQFSLNFDFVVLEEFCEEARSKAEWDVIINTGKCRHVFFAVNRFKREIISINELIVTDIDHLFEIYPTKETFCQRLVDLHRLNEFLLSDHLWSKENPYWTNRVRSELDYDVKRGAGNPLLLISEEGLFFERTTSFDYELEVEQWLTFRKGEKVKILTVTPAFLTTWEVGIITEINPLSYEVLVNQKWIYYDRLFKLDHEKISELASWERDNRVKRLEWDTEIRILLYHRPTIQLEDLEGGNLEYLIEHCKTHPEYGRGGEYGRDYTVFFIEDYNNTERILEYWKGAQDLDNWEGLAHRYAVVNHSTRTIVRFQFGTIILWFHPTEEIFVENLNKLHE